MVDNLKDILPFIIGPHQGVFVQGSNILYGIITIHEVSHLIAKLGKESMMLKLDISKANDRINWTFLLKLLEKFGFREDRIDHTKECISSITLSILINIGVIISFFLSKRGLIQGDPLSLFLFINVAKGLCRSCMVATLQGKK